MIELPWGKWGKISDRAIYPVILVLFLYHIFTLRYGTGWGFDQPAYISQAVDLVNFGQFSQFENYPYGFPLLLAVVYILTGPGTFQMQLLVTVTLILALFVFYWIVRTELDPVSSVLLVIVVGITPFFLTDNFKYISILSDFPFLLFFFLAIYLVKKNVFDYENKDFVIGILLGVTIACSISIRTPGIILIPSLLTIQLVYYALARKIPTKREVLGIIIPYISFALIACSYILIFPYFWQRYGFSFDDDTLFSIISNILQYIDALRNYLPPVFSNFIVYFILIVVVIYAIFKKIRTQYYLLIIMGFYLLLFTIWSPVENMRYLIPIFPFVMFFIFCGFKEIQKLIERKGNIDTKNMIIIGISILIIATSLYYAVPIINTYNILNQSTIKEGPNTPEVQEAFAFISNNVPKNERVAFRYPGYIPMYTGRKDFGGSRKDRGRVPWDGRSLFNISKMQNIQFVLLQKDKDNFGLFNKSLKKEPLFKPIYENPKYILLKSVQ